MHVCVCVLHKMAETDAKNFSTVMYTPGRYCFLTKMALGNDVNFFFNKKKKEMIDDEKENFFSIIKYERKENKFLFVRKIKLFRRA